jgi:hypothetical protein
MTTHADLRLSLVVVVCSLAGCGVSHDAPVQVTIEDVGEIYTVCRGSVIVRRELSFAEVTYQLESDEFLESGVKRFAISKLDKLVPVDMPRAMPDPDSDLDGNGNRYREGTVYRWDGGLEAVIEKGEWKPVTVTRELPSCARESAPALPKVRRKAEPDIRRRESIKGGISQLTDNELLNPPITGFLFDDPDGAPKPIR